MKSSSLKSFLIAHGFKDNTNERQTGDQLKLNSSNVKISQNYC